MAHRRSNFRIASRSSSKRQTEWVNLNFDAAVLSAVSSTLFTTSFVPLVSGLTLIRMRGELIVSSLMNAATDAMTIAVGCILVSDEAVAAGVASIPSPITDADDDWLYYQWCSVQSGVLGAPGQGTEFRFNVDNKAMRRFPAGKTLVAVAEASSEGGTVVTDFIFNCRGLIKLP